MTIMAHAHHREAGQAWTGAARSAVERGGEQWTDLRASVFEVLATFGGPASAYDITDAVSKQVGRRIAANSVYRILDLFVATNVAMRIESRNAYLANAHPDCLHDCIFLVCDGCGTTTHIDDDRIADQVRGAARATGFTPVRPVLEVRGNCAACADGSAIDKAAQAG